MSKIYIKTTEGIRHIGNLDNGVFTSIRHSSTHLYRKLNAWGVDYKALQDMMENKGLHTVVIHDKDTGKTYHTKAENFFEHGTVLHFKPHRTQIFLPLEFWEVS